ISCTVLRRVPTRQFRYGMLCNDFFGRYFFALDTVWAILHGTYQNGWLGGTMTNVTRRSVLRGATGVLAGALVGRPVLGPTRLFAQARRGASAEGVKALVYDVFGTCTDWRNGVARDAERILKPLGYNLDWHAFADAWRALYQPSMEEVRSGRQPFVKL